MSPSSSSLFRDKTAHPLAGATVLQIVPALDQGASARATIDVAAALCRADARALVASRGGPLVSELQAMGGVFAPLPADTKNPLNIALNVRRLANIINTERVDVVHARSRAPAWAAYGATRLGKTPFVTSFSGYYARGGPLALRYNSVMARGDCIIADSVHTAGVLINSYPAAKNRIRVIVGGADCRLFSPKSVTPTRVRAVRRLWGAAPDERVVLIATGAPRSSGYKTAIEAVRLFARDHASADGTKFIVACDEQGASAKEIDAAIGKAELQGIMRRGETEDRPAALLAACAVVVVSANPEAFGALALEAQAMGAPVIVAGECPAAEGVAAPPDVDDAMRSGWRTGCKPDELAAALGEALRLGATARDRLSLRARAHVEAHFSIEEALAQTLAAYAAARDHAR